MDRFNEINASRVFGPDTRITGHAPSGPSFPPQLLGYEAEGGSAARYLLVHSQTRLSSPCLTFSVTSPTYVTRSLVSGNNARTFSTVITTDCFIAIIASGTVDTCIITEFTQIRITIIIAQVRHNNLHIQSVFFKRNICFLCMFLCSVLQKNYEASSEPFNDLLIQNEQILSKIIFMDEDSFSLNFQNLRAWLHIDRNC